MHTEAELQRITISLQAVFGEMTARVRMSCAGQSELLMDEKVLRRMQGAISYECWTELDFNNELKADR
jgi:hypothetical protein